MASGTCKSHWQLIRALVQITRLIPPLLQYNMLCLIGTKEFPELNVMTFTKTSKEAADEMTATAALTNALDITLFCSNLKPHIRQNIHKTRQADWDEQKDDKLHLINPLLIHPPVTHPTDTLKLT